MAIIVISNIVISNLVNGEGQFQLSSVSFWYEGEGVTDGKVDE